MHKNEPKQESGQATLARVKKEMDEPRMAESTRQKLEKLPQSNVVKRVPDRRAAGNAPEEEK